MRIGIISDIHGNSKALEKAFALAPEAEQWLCLGDAINQFRFSNTVVGLIQERCSDCILGNHEEMFFSSHGARARASPGIDRSLMRWLGDRPQERRLRIAGRNLHLVHSTPWSPRGDYIYPHSPAFSRFGNSDADILLYGHTHQPVATRIQETLVINPGSVGEGRPADEGYLFSFALLDLPEMNARIVDFTVQP